jgi:TonB-dependent starch-binding outer membrane protein SusC
VLLKILRYLFTLILVTTLIIPSRGLAQSSSSIDITISNQPVKELLTQIERQTKFTFVYSNTEINVERLVTYIAKAKTIIEILDEVFREQGIKFQIIGSHIVLTRQVNQQIEPVSINIMGSVYDARDSIPLAGVNVFIKNANIGTVSNTDGTFSITSSEQSNTLVFSFVGYTTATIETLGDTRLEVYLNESPQILEEVVAYGYGKDSKKIISSAISSIQADRLTDFVAPVILESLKGKLTGLTVCKNSGTPGGAMTLRIRGISSITAGADPLYVVDGVPIIAQDLSLIIFSGQGVNTISDLNPLDVESISVLKDASATAIYGARGSNGVILITTKRGKPQSPQIRFDANLALQEVAKTYQMLNAEQFMRLRNEASINDGGSEIYSEAEIVNNTIDVDWQDQIYRVAPTQSYNLSIAGGEKDVNYFFSGHYLSQDGIVIGTDFKKYGARFNVDQQINRRLNLGSSLTINTSTNNRKEGDQSLNSPVSMALSRYPTYPIFNSDRTYNDDGPYANPLSIAMQHTNLAYNWRTFGNVFGNYKITSNLSYSFKYGFDFVNFREHTFDPPSTRQGAKYQGLGIESTSEVRKNFISNTLIYSKTLKENHTLDLLGGYEFEKEKRSSTYLRGELFASDILEYIISSAEKIAADAFVSESAIVSYFGRARYNYKSKYIATINARYDGSSRFSNKNKFGLFPSGDLLWRISEEEFFDIRHINDLKIRASYGKTGNDKIPDFLYMARYRTAEYSGSSAIYPVNISNPNLRWEQTKQLNIGIDASTFNNRIGFSLDYYHKKTEDLLLNKPTPPSSGFSGIITNIGKIENRGIELQVTSVNYKQLLHWESALTLSANRNKVTELYNNQPIDNIGRGSQRIEVGEPIGIFYGYKSLGVDPSTGDLVFEDLNGDGIINVNDKQKLGSPYALFDGGLSNILTYKNFDLNFFLQFSYGNQIFNGTRRYIETMKANNQWVAVLDRWSQPGDITSIPRATYLDPNENNRVSSRFVEDGSFIRLKSLKLSYNLEERVLKRIKLSHLGVYLQAQNLFTLTKFSGMDPEVNYAGADAIRSGVEFFTYPTARVYSFGLTVNF